MGAYEESYKHSMDAHRIARKLAERKTLTIQTLERTLRAGGYRGSSAPFWGSLTYGGESYTGISVNEDTALTYTAYWACVRLLTETVASLPCLTYQTIERGKTRAKEHPNYHLLHNEPNPETDSFTFFESLMYHLVAVNGNAYVYIDYEDDLTTIKYLWLMRPDRVQVSRDDKTKEIIYTYTFADGNRTIPSYRVWHIPGLGYDGLVGYTPLSLLRQSIGLGLATEKFGAKLFSNGTNLGGYLEHPGKMTDPAQERLRKNIEEKHEGLDNAHKLLVLEEGMKYAKNTIPPNDAQMLETRKFQRSEMATFFHIPPHMIGDLDRATFSNIEEQSLEFVVYTIRPWLVRIERSANRKLYAPAEKGVFFTEFLVDGLLRGDIESRYRAHAIARNWGWESANDVLEIENKNGIGEQGDIYMAPQNMIPADQFNQMVPQKPKPAQPKE